MCACLCKHCRELLCDKWDCFGCSPCNLVLHCTKHGCVRTSDACVPIHRARKTLPRSYIRALV